MIAQLSSREFSCHTLLAFEFWYALPHRERTKAKLKDYIAHYLKAYGIDLAFADEQTDKAWEKIPAHLKAEEGT